MNSKIALVFDTANERVVVGITLFDESAKTFLLLDGISEPALRASNQKLLVLVDKVLKRNNMHARDISLVGVGVGPGSFTGVRIAVATAKGICLGLKIPCVALSTLDSIAWQCWNSGFRENLIVVNDAMRKEVYPAFYFLDEEGVERKSPNCVTKADEFAKSLETRAEEFSIVGDALYKYKEKFDSFSILDEDLWSPNAKGLVLSLSALYKEKEKSIFCLEENDAENILPIYTRLSDAEEDERKKHSISEKRNLTNGVGNLQNGEKISFLPCSLNDAIEIAKIENFAFSDDKWSEESFFCELENKNNIWIKATYGDLIVGYVGAKVSYETAEILKICVAQNFRHKKIATKLFLNLAEKLRDLCVDEIFLEVRATNDPAISFYEGLNFKQVSKRPHYYGDGEDALIYKISIDDISILDKSNFKEVLHEKSNDLNNPVIFAFESSCDETAASIVDGDGDVVSSVISSSAEFHARFGGVVPEIASRKHIEVISAVAKHTLFKANMCDFSQISAIAVTSQPGLVGSLVVGQAFAKGLSWACGLPLILIDHLEGHLYANKFAKKDIKLPCVASLISGGNTTLILVKNWGEYSVLGGTIDDAVGEAYDKVAKALSLPYPGGPIVSKLASEGDPSCVDLPRPMMYTKDLKMSLSGLKTAVMLEIEKVRASSKNGSIKKEQICNICASFEKSISDVQVAKATSAIKETHAQSFCFGGGVAANQNLREKYREMCKLIGVEYIVSPKEYCGDNASMIGLAALDKFNDKQFSPLDSDVSNHSPLSSRGL